MTDPQGLTWTDVFSSGGGLSPPPFSGTFGNVASEGIAEAGAAAAEGILGLALGVLTLDGDTMRTLPANPSPDGQPTVGDYAECAGHRKNKRESNREGHEEGDARRGRDKGGEGGDQKRPSGPRKNQTTGAVVRTRPKIRMARSNRAGLLIERARTALSGESVSRKCALQAKRWALEAAELGNIEANWAVACFYLHGQMVRKSIASALPFLERAAAAGHPGALSNLAYVLQERGDLKRAFIIFKRLAYRGSAWAATEYARCLGTGSGTKKNLVASARWCLVGAERGDKDAMSRVISNYKEGVGVPVNKRLARDWERRLKKWVRGRARARSEAVALAERLDGKHHS